MTVALPISVLVQTKNEEVGIAACLDGLGEFGEVVVVDSHSEDSTSSIARARGVRVENFQWNGQYPKKKQWQLDNLQTRYDWILFLDADEIPTPNFIAELRNFLQDTKDFVAGEVPLDYVFAGKQLKHGHKVRKWCLVKREGVRFPVLDDLGAPGMGELEGHYQPEAKGPVYKFRGTILHKDLDPVSTWFQRHNKYSDWEAYIRNRPAVRAVIRGRRTLQGRLFDLLPFKPFAFFFYAYVLRAGFMDGRAGFDYAFALSAYYWQIGLKTREARRA